jgi:hypothetical protein
VPEPESGLSRLIRLLTMLPRPGYDTFEPFWQDVADAHEVGLDYVTEKISTYLGLVRQGQRHGATGLASYALSFFGEADEGLAAAIATEIDRGSPNASAGRAWMAELRTAAFTVLYDAHTDTAAQEAVAAWIAYEREY